MQHRHTGWIEREVRPELSERTGRERLSPNTKESSQRVDIDQNVTSGPHMAGNGKMSLETLPGAHPLGWPRAFLTVFAPLAGLLVGLLGFVYLVEVRTEARIFEETEQKVIDSLEAVTVGVVAEVVSDVMFLADHHALQALLDGDSSQRQALEQDYLAFSREKRVYDQIRYLDETGMEVVRVNYNRGNPKLVAAEQFQNKGKRYYFADAFALGPGEVFASPLDLNIERGEIEQPLKPMLRIATPVFDSAGRKRGIVVVNFFGQQVLDRLTSAYEGSGDVLLLNSDGYFLKGHTPADEWHFMYPDRTGGTLAERHPAVWRKVQAADRGSVRTDAGLFSFRTVRLVTEADATSTGAVQAYARSTTTFDASDYRWYLISHVPTAVLTIGSARVGVNLAVIFAILLTLAAVVSWYVARVRKARNDAQIALGKASERLARSNAELEEFAYVASHDLQEPLRKITAFGGRLQSKYGAELGERGQDYITRMTGAAHRMQTLIEDLLTYSRVTTKAQPHVRVDLDQVVREVLGDLETRIEELNGTVTLESLPSIDADPVQMRQLFQNLIGNALKFHQADVPPTVTVASTLDGGGAVEMTVTDNGIGFEAEHAERIFGTFQRLHGRSAYEGTGIGLSVCRKIVQQHHGWITASSQPGQGTTFTFALAAKQPKEYQDAA